MYVEVHMLSMRSRYAIRVFWVATVLLLAFSARSQSQTITCSTSGGIVYFDGTNYVCAQSKVSADQNSITAPDQVSADRVNGLWNFDQMGTNITTDLVQAGCTSGVCSSNSGTGTTSMDP